MAYPQLITANSVYSTNTTSSTTKTVTMPTVLAGDCIVVAFGGTSDGSATTVNMSTGLGTFTKAQDGRSGTSIFAVWYKFADGTESGLTTTISLANSVNIAISQIACHVVRGTHVTKPPVFQWSLALTTYDPPSVTATWGADDNLFVAMMSNPTSSAGIFTSYPTGYSNGSNNRVSSAGISAQASKQSALDTDDPSAFVIGSASGRVAAIAAVFGSMPAATISDINGGNPIEFGETGIVINLSGYGSTPNSVTATYESGTKTLSFSNIAGDSSSITVDAEARSDGVDYPKSGDAIRVTVSNGTDSSYIDTTVVRPAGETGQTFVLPIFDDDDYFGYEWTQDGFTVEGASFDYTTSGFVPDDFDLHEDSGFDSTSGGLVTGYFRPSTGTGAGNVYYYEFTINGWTITTSGGLTSSGLTSGGLTRAGLTSAGL